MNEILSKILDQLCVAKVQVQAHSVRKQINLFEKETGPEISFNNYKTLLDYQSHLDSMYNDCKTYVEQQVNKGYQMPEEIKKSFDISRIEIIEFKKHYFPKGNDFILFNRVKFFKMSINLTNDEVLKDKIYKYFKLQYHLIDLLEKLFVHRLDFLNKYCSAKQLQSSSNSEFSLPTHKELSSYYSGQLSLFPCNSGFTSLKWNRDKIEFIELFMTIYYTNSIVRLDNKHITKKDYMELMMWFFNIKIAHWQGSFSYAKDRKIKRESEYLKELVTGYNKLVSEHNQ